MIDSTMLASMFLLGLGVGVVFGWLAKSLRAQKRVTDLSTTLEIERTNNDGLVQTFEALSDKALRQPDVLRIGKRQVRAVAEITRTIRLKASGSRETTGWCLCRRNSADQQPSFGAE
jgi:hypothetical protein